MVAMYRDSRNDLEKSAEPEVGRKGISLSRGGKAQAVRTGRLAKKNQEAGTPHRTELSGGERGGRIEQGQHRLRLGVGGIEAQGGLRVGAGRRQLAVLVANHGAVGPGAGVGRRFDDVLVEKFQGVVLFVRVLCTGPPGSPGQSRI